MLAAASPPSPCLPSSSLLDNPHHQQHSEVPVYQRGVQGNIRPRLASSPSSPNHPSSAALFLFSPPPAALLDASSLQRPTVSLQAPATRASTPASRMAAQLSGFTSFSFYLIINLLIFLTTPRPPLLSQVTRRCQPRCRTFHRESWEETRAGGWSRLWMCREGREGLIKLLYSQAWFLSCCCHTMKVIWSVPPHLTLFCGGGCTERECAASLGICPCPWCWCALLW